MATVTYVDPQGTQRAVDVPAGRSVMQGAVQNGVPGIPAECGGNLSCATCHVYVDAAWADRVGACETGSLEDDMLDNAASDRLPTSRLSCQIVISEILDGLVVHVAPEQL